MHRRTKWLAAGLLAVPAVAFAQPAEPHRLGWLQGCWAAVDRGRVTEEQWMSPRARTLVGSSRTAEGDKLVSFEFMLIREKDGKLVFEARPGGRPAVSFTAAELTDSSVVFENVEHEFPQKIGYRKNGDNTVLAWIEGKREGQPVRIEYPYRQVVCAGS